MKTSINAGSGNNDIGSITLDGQGHRIYNIKHCLFVNLTGSTVINLDLLDAKVTDGNALLANAITNSTISNMTLSGNLQYSNNNKIGGLAGESKDSNIYSVMSNVKLDSINVVAKSEELGNKASADCILVGGIVGYFDGGMNSIAYCANNGPIVVSIDSGIANVYTGGIVGYINSGTVKYSYNTNSVLGGYIDDKNSNYYTGGIAGAAGFGFSVTLNYCYNSGMIKSGNKSVGDGNKISYAAGIVAYAENATVSNCTNTGFVEALGKNPTYKISGSFDNITHRIIINMKFEGERNVFAYGIGYGIVDTNCQSIDNVINNGNVTGVTTNTITKEYPYEEETYWATAGGGDSRAGGGVVKTIQTSVYYGGYSSATCDVITKIDSNEVVITGYDNFGVPVSFYVKTKTVARVKIWNGKHEEDALPSNAAGTYYSMWSSYLPFNDTNTISYYENKVNENKYLFGYSTGSVISGSGSCQSNILTSPEWITKKGGDETISISGKEYLFSSNGESIISNIDSTNSWTLDITFNNVDYFEDKSVYTLEVGKMNGEGDDVVFEAKPNTNIIINNCEKISDNLPGVTFNITVYSPVDEFDSTDTIRCIVNHSIETTLDLSTLNYAIDKAGNVTIKNMSLTEEEKGYLTNPTISLYDKEGESLGEVFKVTVSINETTNESIYLKYENGQFIYYKDAYLSKAEAVNKANVVNTKDILHFAGKKIKILYYVTEEYIFEASEVINKANYQGQIAIVPERNQEWTGQTIEIGKSITNAGQFNNVFNNKVDSNDIEQSIYFEALIPKNGTGNIYYDANQIAHLDTSAQLIADVSTLEINGYSVEVKVLADSTPTQKTLSLRYTGAISKEAYDSIFESIQNKLTFDEGLTVGEESPTIKDNSDLMYTRRIVVSEGANNMLLKWGENVLAKFNNSEWVSEDLTGLPFVLTISEKEIIIKSEDKSNIDALQVCYENDVVYTIDVPLNRDGKDIGKYLLANGNSILATYDGENFRLSISSIEFEDGLKINLAIEDGKIKLTSSDVTVQQIESLTEFFVNLQLAYEYQHNLPTYAANSQFPTNLTGLKYYEIYTPEYNVNSDKLNIDANGKLSLSWDNLNYVGGDSFKVYLGTVNYDVSSTLKLSRIKVTLNKERSYYEISLGGELKEGVNDGQTECIIEFNNLEHLQDAKLKYLITRKVYEGSSGTQDNSNENTSEVIAGKYEYTFTHEGVNYTYIFNAKESGKNIKVSNIRKTFKVNDTNGIERNVELAYFLENDNLQVWTIAGYEGTLYSQDGETFYSDKECEKAINFATSFEISKEDEEGNEIKYNINFEKANFTFVDINIKYLDINKENVTLYLDTKETFDDATMSVSLSTGKESSIGKTMPDKNEVSISFDKIPNGATPNFPDIEDEYNIYGDDTHTTIVYQPDGRDSLKVEISKMQDESVTPTSWGEKQSNTIYYSGVVLTKNVNVKLLKAINFGGEDRLNYIAGDNYTLTFTSSSGGLFESIAGGASIKDLKIVGIINGYKTEKHLELRKRNPFAPEIKPLLKALLKYEVVYTEHTNYKSVVAMQNNGKLKNIDTFGTLTIEFNQCIGKNYYAYLAAGVTIKNNGTMENINNYVSIVGSNQTEDNSLLKNKTYKNQKIPIISGITIVNGEKNATENVASTSGLTNYGVLVAGNGKRAKAFVSNHRSSKRYRIEPWTIGEDWVRVVNGMGYQGANGNDGFAGGNIYMLAYENNIESASVTNEQHVFPGSGGNAGAGESGQNGLNFTDTDSLYYWKTYSYTKFFDTYYDSLYYICLNGNIGGRAGIAGDAGSVYRYSGNTEIPENKVHNAENGASAQKGNLGLPGYMFPSVHGGWLCWQIKGPEGSWSLNSGEAKTIGLRPDRYARAVLKNAISDYMKSATPNIDENILYLEGV